MATAIKYPTSTNAVQKTLDAALLAGATTSMTLNSVTGIQNKAGVCVVDRVDANGSDTASKREYITFTGVSGSTLTGLTRNADGGGTDQDHAVGAIVEFVSDVLQQQAVIDGLLNVVTTAGALDTTKVVDLTTAQTLTNKTLTSPKINEDVALTATATQLNAVGSGGVTTRLSSKIIEITRDLAADSGDVAYTGVGFLPSAIIVFGGTGGNGFNIGMADSAKTNRVLTKYADSTNYVNAAGSIGSNLIFYSVTSGNRQTAIVKSYDADGFTLTWTKTGSPTGIITLEVLCFR